MRDPQRRANVALLSPQAFAATDPEVTETWRVFVRADAVQAWREFPEPMRIEFSLADFANDPRMAA